MKTMKKLWERSLAMLLMLAIILPLLAPVIEAVDWYEGMTANVDNDSVETVAVASEGTTKIEAEHTRCFYSTAIGRRVCPKTMAAGTTDYSNDAFVTGFTKNPGAYIEIPILVEQAGVYTLEVCYANGNASQTEPEFSIYVEDTLVDTHAYAYTGDNGTFSNKWFHTGTHTIEVELAAGEQNLRIVAGEELGTNAINLDYVALTRVTAGEDNSEDTEDATETEMTADTTHNSTAEAFPISFFSNNKIEAESAKRFWPTALNKVVGMGSSANAGEFSGEGYVMGFAYNPGAYIEFPVEVQQPGTYTLQICYANGFTSSLEFNVYADDALVDSHFYESSGSWKNYSIYEIALELTSDTESIKFEAGTSVGGGINVDYITVVGPAAEMTAAEGHNSTVETFVVSPDSISVMEAEQAKRFWPTALNRVVCMGSSANAGEFSGEGYVMGFAYNPGAYIEFPVEVQESGSYILQIRYANGFAADLEYAVYVDDVLIEDYFYEPTGGWNQWSIHEIEVVLEAGVSSLKFVAGFGTGGGINVDYIAVATEGNGMTGDTAHNATVSTFVIEPDKDNRLEAEDAKRFWPIEINRVVGMGNSVNAGVFSGEGYAMGFASNPGSYIEFPIQVEETGTYIIQMRYANGYTSAWEFDIYIDDTLVDNHYYEGTGGWKTWTIYEIEVELTTENTSLRFVAGEDVGSGINLDYISVCAEDVTPDAEPSADPFTADEEHNSTVDTVTVSSNTVIKMEAEAAKRFWPTALNRVVGMGTSTNAGVFSGEGYVKGFASNPGAYIEFPIQVEAEGTYVLRIRYANGYEDSCEFAVHTDDQLVNSHDYTSTGAWKTWSVYEIELELTTDVETLKIVAGEGVGAGINIDYISLRAKGVEPEKEPVIDLTIVTGDEAHNSSVDEFEISADSVNVLEAEDAKRFWPTARNLPVSVGSKVTAGAFSGEGYVLGFANNPGAYIEYPVKVKENGTYLLRVRYANGFTDSLEFEVYVDDKPIDNHYYESTSKWVNWGIYEIELELTTDTKTIRFVAGEDVAGGINLDYISVRAEGVDPEEELELDLSVVIGNDAHNSTVGVFAVDPNAVNLFEAEKAKRFWPVANGVSVAMNNSAKAGAFSGEGYVMGFANNVGAYIEYPIQVQQDGTYLLRVRYANGFTDALEFSIYLDDVLVDNHFYESTSRWSSWGIYEIELELTTDAKSLKFMAAEGVAGGINLDYISIRAEGVEPEVEPELDIEISFEDVIGDEEHNATTPTFDITLGDETKMEAELAKRFWLTSGSKLYASTTHAGYTGAGFAAGFYCNHGAYLEFPLNVKENGTYIVRIRYANGSMDTPAFNVYVDDKLVDSHGYEPIGAWTNWYSYELKVDLTTDAKVLRFVAVPGLADGINIDYIAIRGEGVESKDPADTLPSIIETTQKHNMGVLPFVITPNKEIRMEAEDAIRYFRSPGKPLNLNVRYSGYSGDGFIAGFYQNYDAYLEFPLDVKQSGKYILTIRYANGAAVYPKYSIYLDDEKILDAEFVKSGSWASWANYSIELDLTTDSKSLRIQAASNIKQGINIDYLSLSYISEDSEESAQQIANPELDRTGTNVEPARDYTTLYIILAAAGVLLLAVLAILIEKKVLFKKVAFFDKMFKR